MRLTLRNMLAYIDRLLEPDDAQDIGKRIEESKHATDLFHRIRDVMRRIRLGDPSLTDRATGLDANTVAEYLDHVMPNDRVPDFEEVCLKSDVHLAEVACSHQILTVVLGERAEIDAASRERMYALPKIAAQPDEERVAAAEVASMLSGDGAARGSTPPEKDRPRPVVPEYLREPRKKRRLLPAAAMMLVLGGIAGIVLVVAGVVDPATVVGWFRERVVASKPAEPEKEGAGERRKGEGGDGAKGAKNEKGEKDGKGMFPGVGKESKGPELAVPGKPLPSGGTAGLAGVTPAAKPATPASGQPAANPGAGEKPVAVAPPGPLPKAPGSLPSPPAPLPAGEGRLLPSGGPEKPVAKPSTEVASVGPMVPPKPVASDGAKQDASPPHPLAPSPLHSPQPLPAAAQAGRFISDGQEVLLKFSPQTSAWNRVMPEEFLVSRQELLALPSFRPRVVILNVGMALELLGGTRIELLGDNAQGQPGVQLLDGRLVIKPLAQPGVRLRLTSGTHSGALTLQKVDTVAAMGIARYREPGTNPEKTASHPVVTLYVTHGEAVWEEDGKNRVSLTAPIEWPLDPMPANVPAPEPAQDYRKWIQADASSLSLLDRQTSATIAQQIQDHPATLTLMELSEHRRSEVRLLAAQCLGCLDRFEPLINSLGDKELRSHWNECFDPLRDAVARGPEPAAAIRQTMEKLFGQDGPAAYRMLWGYSDDDLKGGEDARLVGFLDHDSLALRVLAFSNLKEITGAGHFYQPEQKAETRKKWVLLWQNQQATGKIRFKTADEKAGGGADSPPAGAPAGKRSPAGRSGPGKSAPGGRSVVAPEPAVEGPAETPPPPAPHPPRPAVPEPAPPPDGDMP